jgi:hypothetical protein
VGGLLRALERVATRFFKTLAFALVGLGMLNPVLRLKYGAKQTLQGPSETALSQR